MSPIVFLPGFDGDAKLRQEFMDVLARSAPVHGVSYPGRALGSLDQYRVHAMAQAPADWEPVLVAESFSGLVAALWAAVDSRVRALVLCGGFARNPVGFAATAGASLPALSKLGAVLIGTAARRSREPRRRRWGKALARTLAALPAAAVAERMRLIAAEDVGERLAGLRIPVLLVHFDSDRVIGPRARSHLESVCHNAQVLRLPGPHFSLETRPTECADAIAARLRGLLPTQP